MADPVFRRRDHHRRSRRSESPDPVLDHSVDRSDGGRLRFRIRSPNACGTPRPNVLHDRRGSHRVISPAPVLPWLIVFGRVPLFYYLLHIPLIHAMALGISLVRGGTPWMFANHPANPGPAPEGYRWSLVLLYLVTAVAVVILYFACRWYGEVKARRKGRWLSWYDAGFGRPLPGLAKLAMPDQNLNFLARTRRALFGRAVAGLLARRARAAHRLGRQLR